MNKKPNWPHTKGAKGKRRRATCRQIRHKLALAFKEENRYTQKEMLKAIHFDGYEEQVFSYFRWNGMSSAIDFANSVDRVPQERGRR